MIILIGLLIVTLLIIVLFYNELIAAKVRIEDAQEALKLKLQQSFNLDAAEVEGKINTWKKDGLELDADTKSSFDILYDAINKYNAKIKKFPYSVMADMLKMKTIDL